MFNMLEGMYHNHPVKIDIAGTVETIAEITAEKLYEVYNVFYNLNNMILCVAGNVTVDGVLKVADKMLKPCEKKEIKKAAEKFMKANSDDVIDEMSATEEIVEEYLELRLIKSKMYAAIIKKC